MSSHFRLVLMLMGALSLTACPEPMPGPTGGGAATGGGATGGGTTGGGATGGGTTGGGTTGGGTTGGGTTGGGTTGGGSSGSPITRIITTQFVFAVRANGEVWTMGPNAERQFDGDRPIDIAGFNDFLVAINSDGGTSTHAALGATRIATGGGHSCVVVSGGAVKCWNESTGFNLEGELGDGTMNRSDTPVDVSGLSGVASLALGSGRSCAVKSDSTVWCWGTGPGNGMGRSLTPVEVPGVSGVTSLGNGTDAFCAITASGARCWGNPYDLPATPDGGGPANGMPAIFDSLADAVEVQGGRDHMCARFTNGTVKCWGMHGVSYDYELGVEMPEASYEPVLVPGINDATQLSVGRSSSCVLRATGRVTCWGSGHSTAGAILKDLPPLP